LHLGEKGFALFAASVDGLFNLLVSCWIEEEEAEVFEFATNFSHTEAMGDGGVDFKRLFGDLVLAIGLEVLEGAHVVQAVGEFDEHYADVVDHGEHHLAQVLGLGLLAGGEVDFADFGDALDDVGHLFAEFFADVDDGD
jgi:hypothetical protein